MTTTTTNMAMVLGTVQETLGPEWAQLLNAALQVVDLHDHSDGRGLPVTPAGMSINDTVDFQANDASNLSALLLQAVTALATSKAGSLQRFGSNLYWINGAGVAVQITSGSSVNSSGSGEITIDEPASFPYSITSGDANKILTVPTNSQAQTLNLPAATTQMLVIIKDKTLTAGTNVITIVPDGTDTIDGDNADYLIDYDGGAAFLISDGVSAWYVF